MKELAYSIAMAIVFWGCSTSEISDQQALEKESVLANDVPIQSDSELEQKLSAESDEGVKKASEPSIALGANLVTFRLPQNYSDIDAYVVGYPEKKAKPTEYIDKDGNRTYILEPEIEGEISIIVTAKDAANTTKGKVLKNIVYKFGETLDLGVIKLDNLGEIRGKAFKNIEGDSIDHSDISVTIPGTSFASTTNSDGSYVISPFVPDYSFDLRFKSQGFATVQFEDLILKPESTELTVESVFLEVNLSREITVNLVEGVKPGSNEIELSLQYDPEVVRYKISTDKDFEDSDWIAISKQIKFDLGEEIEDGTNLVYLMFNDVGGVPHGPFSVEVGINKRAPKIENLVLFNGVFEGNKIIHPGGGTLKINLSVDKPNSMYRISKDLTELKSLDFKEMSSEVMIEQSTSLMPHIGEEDFYIQTKGENGLLGDILTFKFFGQLLAPVSSTIDLFEVCKKEGQVKSDWNLLEVENFGDSTFYALFVNQSAPKFLACKYDAANGSAVSGVISNDFANILKDLGIQRILSDNDGHIHAVLVAKPSRFQPPQVLIITYNDDFDTISPVNEGFTGDFQFGTDPDQLISIESDRLVLTFYNADRKNLLVAYFDLQTLGDTPATIISNFLPNNTLYFLRSHIWSSRNSSSSELYVSDTSTQSWLESYLVNFGSEPVSVSNITYNNPVNPDILLKDLRHTTTKESIGFIGRTEGCESILLRIESGFEKLDFKDKCYQRVDYLKSIGDKQFFVMSENNSNYLLEINSENEMKTRPIFLDQNFRDIQFLNFNSNEMFFFRPFDETIHIYEY